MATRTQKPAAKPAAPVVPATPVYSDEMLAVARESLKDHKNRARIAHALGMGEFKLNGIQRSIREKMGLTDTKEACKKLLAHVQQLASPTSEATDMVAEAVTKCAKTPEPTANPAWLLTIRELEGKLGGHADAIRVLTKQKDGYRIRATSAEAQVVELKKAIDLERAAVSQVRRDRDDAIAHQNGLYSAIVERLDSYYPADSRDLEWDVLPGTLAALARRCKENTEALDQLRTTQSELRAILMPAMGIEPENWPAYSLTDAAQGVVELAADRLKDVGDWKSSAEEKHELLQRLSKDLNTSTAEIERLRGTIVERNDRNSALLSERDSHSATAAKIRRRLKAWQTIGILGALVSALLGAGLTYWGIRK